MGAWLGAIVDVLPAERFEPDSGPDAEMEHLRAGLAIIFEGLDDHAGRDRPGHGSDSGQRHLVGDPWMSPRLWPTSLAPRARRHRRGPVVVAVQLSVGVGERGAMALRVIHSVVAHVRLDADPDTVAEAEFDALNR